MQYNPNQLLVPQNFIQFRNGENNQNPNNFIPNEGMQIIKPINEHGRQDIKYFLLLLFKKNFSVPIETNMEIIPRTAQLTPINNNPK